MWSTLWKNFLKTSARKGKHHCKGPFTNTCKRRLMQKAQAKRGGGLLTFLTLVRGTLEKKKIPSEN